MPKQPNDNDDTITHITCRSCGHTIISISDMPQLIQELVSSFQNEIAWYEQKIADLEDELFIARDCHPVQSLNKGEIP